jgi:hypothetical protein
MFTNQLSSDLAPIVAGLLVLATEETNGHLGSLAP